MPRILTAGLTDYWHLFDGLGNVTIGCNREFGKEMFRARRKDLPPGHPVVCGRCFNTALDNGGQLELPGIRERMDATRRTMLNATLYGKFAEAPGERPAFQTQETPPGYRETYRDSDSVVFEPDSPEKGT